MILAATLPVKMAIAGPGVAFVFKSQLRSQKIVALNAQAFFASIRVVHSHQLKTSQCRAFTVMAFVTAIPVVVFVQLWL